MATVHTQGDSYRRVAPLLRRGSLSVLIALLVSVAAVTPASAGDGTWTPVQPGPKGQGFGVTSGTDTTYPEVKAFAVDPSNPSALIAGGGFGLYRSADRGKTWSRVLPAPPTPAAAAWFSVVRFDPSDASVVYATTDAQFG